MKQLYLAFWLWVFSLSLSAQNTIFLFDWEGTDPKQAAIGPSATTIGNRALTKTRLDGNSKGLAAPLGSTTAEKQDIVMVLTNNPIFNVAGIDLSFDYQGDEKIATIFSRGNFRMGFDGMNVRYRVTLPDGSCSTPISSSSVAITDDDIYRNYRFLYDPNTGSARLTRDGTLQWSNAGSETPGQALCWTGDGDITVGVAMDGSGRGNALLDNLRMQEVAPAGLPIKLVRFGATLKGKQVALSWETASERENEKFVIERLAAGRPWEAIAEVAGAGNSTGPLRYAAVDVSPVGGTSYYRLKQVDFGGEYSHSTVAAIRLEDATPERLRAFPNPTSGRVDLSYPPDEGTLQVFTAQGREVTAGVSLIGTRMDLQSLPSGVYYLRVGREVRQVVKR